MLFWLRTALILCALSFGSFAYGQASEDPVKVELLTEQDSIQPSGTVWVALHFKLDDHWHAYWKNPGDAGMPINVQWELPEGFVAGQLEWPYPQRFSQDSFIGYGYEGEVYLLAQIKAPATIKDKEVKIKANARWVVCADSCLPGDAELSVQLPVGDQKSVNSEKAKTFSDARSKMPAKQDKVVAERKNNLIEIVVQPSKALTQVTKVYFAPEAKKMINHEVEALLTKQDSAANSYTLALSDVKTGEKAKALKGVIVFQSGNTIVDAISIDVPIGGADSEGELSMLDPRLKAVKVTPAEEADEPATNPGTNNEFEGGFFVALVLAFVGGMILNLMPCVLPVVSFKVLSFVKMAGQSRSLTLKHGLAFSMGVIISFWALAGALLILQAYGRSVGWGFQLQEPLFVAILAAIIFIFGLSLFGVFEVGISMTNWAGQAGQSKAIKPDTMLSSFFSGVLATAVATPCTGPFLGSAVGFAVTLPAILSMIIFTSLGIGMAFPYLLLSAFPSLLRFMPRPGNWMVTFKELMGFLMLATVLWLIWVFGAQTGSLAIFMLLTGFLFLALGGWIYGKWGTPVKSLNTRITSYVFALSCAVIAGYSILTAVSPEVAAMEDKQQTVAVADSWEPFSPERVASLQKQGIPVFVDFTAKWCLICQANHVVLQMDPVHARMREMGVVRMKADWTRNDPVITEALKKHGRNGVPLYLLYGTDPTQPPKILPQVLTPDVVIDELNSMDTRLGKA